MSLSSREVWLRLEGAGLATPEQRQRWAAEINTSLSGDQAENGLQLLQGLIERKHLSKYQAKIIAGQSTGALRWGSWMVEQPIRSPLWQGWYLMQGDQGATSWGRPLQGDVIASVPELLPSLTRARTISQLRHPGLPACHAPEVIDGTLLISVTPPFATSSNAAMAEIPATAMLLVQRFTDQRYSQFDVTRIVIKIAEALAAMHERGVAHGRVLPDRVYIHEQQVALLVDPLFAATGFPEMATKEGTTPRAAPSGLFAQQLLTWHVAQFLAPELFLPSAVPTPASDVYSLGIIWWWLLTGQPLDTTQASNGSSTHVTSTAIPALPADRSLPAPLWHCLQACVAKNLSSRFASASELIRAFAAVDRAIAAAKPTAVASIPSANNPAGNNPAGNTELQAASHLAAKSVSPKSSAQARSTAALSEAPGVSGLQLATRTAPAIPRRRRRRSAVPWLWPILGGSCALVGLLLVLSWTGALQPSTEAEQGKRPRSATQYEPNIGESPQVSNPTAPDPRSDVYEIVEGSQVAASHGLWAPPHAPDPVLIDLLPPGGQMFVSWHPAQWSQSNVARNLRSAVSDPMTSLEETTQTMAGMPVAEIAQVTVAFYAPERIETSPVACWRFRLQHPMTVGELKAAWNSPMVEQVATQRLLVGSAGKSYFIVSLSDDEKQLVGDFSVGPREAMVDAAELSGERGPLAPQLERLWKSSDSSAELTVLVATPFLFTDGRELLHSTPSRFNQYLKQWLGGDARAASLQMHCEPSWYWETRVIGTNDIDAGKIMARQQQEVQALPATVEQWLVNNSAHPYWRALALRYPHMLRTFAEYSRFGVEQGTALMNCYLPSDGGTNLLLASWIALQQHATQSIAVDASTDRAVADMVTPQDIEAYLSLPIRLSFDQEPIEVALRLVGEEANAEIAPGATPLRFLLDGDAFEKGGITRNQQLRNFRMEQKPVREALTEIAKLGNPDRTVTDLHQEKQSLIWVIKPDPESKSGASMISLTTRAAANEADIDLPSEFAK